MSSHALLILAGALSGGFVLGLIGFGNGLTAYGFWLYALTPQISAPLVAIGSILGHLLMFRGFHRAMSRDRIVPIVIGGLAGVPVGVWLLTFIPANAFRIFGGLLLAAYSLVSLAGGLRFRVGNRTPLRDGIIGLFGGICGGLASLSGPIMTIWCGLKGSGVWIGRTCYGRVDAELFRRIVLILLTISGLVLIAQSLEEYLREARRTEDDRKEIIVGGVIGGWR